MEDTKAWWQSKIIWAQIVSVGVTVGAAFHLLPATVDQQSVVAAITSTISIGTALMRLFSTHKIG